ncbi:MAG: phosphoglucosamine mutase [Planctomycetota bacterium]
MTDPDNAQTRIFGTDGIRGVANTGPLEPQSLLRLACVLGDVLRERGTTAHRPMVLVGHDGRRSWSLIQGALVAGFNAEGVDVQAVGLVPTPVLAFLTRRQPCNLGIMISASHNPMRDNGVKLFVHDGTKFPDDLEREVEKRLRERDLSHERLTGDELGEFTEQPTLTLDYLEHLRNKAFKGLDLSGLKIVVDCANGGSSLLAPRVLSAFGAEVVSVNDGPSGTNINEACGALHPESIGRLVVQEKADLGLTLDGDGDRAILVDETGKVRSGDAILAIVARDLVEKGKLHESTVVATIMSNIGLELFLERLGVTMLRTPVGDRFVAAELREHGYSIGGEQSGHVIFGSDHDFNGDGLYTGLRVLEILAAKKKPLGELLSDFRLYPQTIKNFPVDAKPPLEELPRVVAAVKKAEEELGGKGRVVLRYSGTESLARVMIEGLEQGQIEAMADEIGQEVVSAIAARKTAG